MCMLLSYNVTTLDYFEVLLQRKDRRFHNIRTDHHSFAESCYCIIPKDVYNKAKYIASLHASTLHRYNIVMFYEQTSATVMVPRRIKPKGEGITWDWSKRESLERLGMMYLFFNVASPFLFWFFLSRISCMSSNCGTSYSAAQMSTIRLYLK